MGVLFATNDFEGILSGEGTFGATTTAGRFDSAMSDVACYVQSIGSKIRTRKVAPQASLWVRYLWHIQIANSSALPFSMRILRDGGVAVFGLYQKDADDNLQMAYWNGSAWVDLGAEFAVTQSNLDFIDVNVSGTGAAVYIDGVLAVSASATMSEVYDLAQVEFGALSSNVSGHSEIIISTDSTIGLRYYTKQQATAEGTNQAWTGAHTDINHLGLNDATVVSSNAADQVQTFTAGARTLDGYSIVGVAVSARCRRGNSGPQKVRPVLRIGSTVYEGNQETLAFAGFNPVQHLFLTDPSTNDPWVEADAESAALEFGLKSNT